MALPLPRVVNDVGPGGGLVDALGSINALAHNMLKRKYYPKDIESQINNRNALTEGQTISNKYMPDKLRLANVLAELQNQWYEPNIQSEINQRNALTEGQMVNNRFMPDKLRLANEMAAMENDYYQPKTKAEIENKKALTNKTNVMTPLEAQELALKNEAFPETNKAELAYKNAMAKYKSFGGAGAGVDQKLLMGLESQLATDHPEWSPEQINDAANAYVSGEETFLDGTPLPPASGKARHLMDVMVKKATTSQGLNQQRFAATTDAILEKGLELIPTVSKYSSLLGKAKGGIDSVKSALGINSPEYNDYMYFTRTFVPYAAGEMMRALGVNASDTQKKIYQQVINPISWDQNPKGTLQNYKKMVELFTSTVSSTVGKSTSEIQSGLRNKGLSKATLRYNPETGDFEEIK